METWRKIKGYSGRFEVSDCGRVRNATVGRLLKLTAIPRYLVVNLPKDGSPCVHRVHALVAEAFLGKRPEGLFVCHNDGNGTNNHISNLRYDTPKGNSDDRYLHGTIVLGEQVWSAKLTEDDVLAIRWEYADGGTSYAKLAKKYGISVSHTGGIIKRRFWAHLTDDGQHLPRDEWDANRDQGNNHYRRQPRLTVDGSTMTLREWAQIKGLPVHIIPQRLKAGWSPEKAVNTPVAVRGQKIEAFGKKLTFRQWAAETNISEKTLRNRITIFGWEPERALSTPPQGKS